MKTIRMLTLSLVLVGLLLCLHHSWAVRRGLSAWRVVAGADDAVRSGSWRT